MSSNHIFEAQFKIGDFEFLAVRGDNPTEFERALGAATASLALIREVQGELRGVTEAAALANVAGIAAPQQDGWNSPPQQTAPAGFANVAQPLTQVPVQPQPQGPVLPAGLSKYNTLIPGLPAQPCAVCGQTAYPVSFTSKAGKTFKKYKCGVDDKNHDNPWI